MLRSPLLGGAPRGPSLPSDPSRPCKSRRSMGLGSLGNERALSLSLFAEPELFPGFYELCGCQRTVVNINNLNLTLVRPPPPQSHPMLDFSSERARRGHGTFYNPEWHGKSNLMSDGGSGNGFKGSSNPSSLNTIVVGRRGVEHKALSPWEE